MTSEGLVIVEPQRGFRVAPVSAEELEDLYQARVELLARGIRVGKERVQKLMQLHGIRARGKRRFKGSLREDMTRDLVIDALRMRGAALLRLIHDERIGPRAPGENESADPVG